MSISSREVIRKIKADGWFEVAQVGSHKKFRHPTKPGIVTVKHPIKDYKPKTQNPKNHGEAGRYQFQMIPSPQIGGHHVA